MRKPIWTKSFELPHVPDHGEVVFKGQLVKVGALIPFNGKMFLSLTVNDYLGDVTVLADRRFEHILHDVELPVLVVGEKLRMDVKAVVIADSLNFPVQPTSKFKQALAYIENR